MFIKYKSIIGVYYNQDILQVMEMEKKWKKFYIKALNHTCLPEGIINNGQILNRKKFIQVIQSLCKNAVPQEIFTQGKEVVISVSEKDVFTHIFQFPITIQPKHIIQNIPYQAEQLIPFSKDDIYWDIFFYNGQRKKKDKYLSVLYAAIPKYIIDQNYKILEDLNFKPTLFSLESELLLKAYLADKKYKKEQGVIIIDFNYSTSLITVIINNKIQTTASTVGLKEFIKAIEKSKKTTIPKEEILKGNCEKYNFENFTKEFNIILSKLSQKIKQSINYSQKIAIETPISKIIITGQCNQLSFIAKHLDQNFEQDIQIGFIFKKVNISLFQKNKKTLFKFGNFEANFQLFFAKIIGICFRGLEKKFHFKGINLLPDIPKKEIYSKQIMSFAKILCAFLFVFIATLSVTFAYLSSNFHYQLQKVEYSNKNLKKIIEGTRYIDIKNYINKFNQEVMTLQKLEWQFFPLVDIINDISYILPSKTEISSINFFDKDLKLQFTGIAKTREDVLAIQQNLLNLSYIKNVNSPISNLDRKYHTSFIITVIFDPQKIKEFVIKNQKIETKPVQKDAKSKNSEKKSTSNTKSTSSSNNSSTNSNVRSKNTATGTKLPSTDINTKFN